MTVPGSNLYARAMRLIKAQPVAYYQNTNRALRGNLIYEAQYAPVATVMGSVQAVPLSQYQTLGLDFARNYVNLYTNTPFVGVERDVSGDLFAFAGKTYQCVSTTDWIAMDGWNAVLAVQVDTAVPGARNYVVTPAGFYWVTPQGNRIYNPQG